MIAQTIFGEIPQDEKLFCLGKFVTLCNKIQTLDLINSVPNSDNDSKLTI